MGWGGRGAVAAVVAFPGSRWSAAARRRGVPQGRFADLRGQRPLLRPPAPEVDPHPGSVVPPAPLPPQLLPPRLHPPGHRLPGGLLSAPRLPRRGRRGSQHHRPQHPPGRCRLHHQRGPADAAALGPIRRRHPDRYEHRSPRQPAQARRAVQSVRGARGGGAGAVPVCRQGLLPAQRLHRGYDRAIGQRGLPVLPGARGPPAGHPRSGAGAEPAVRDPPRDAPPPGIVALAPAARGRQGQALRHGSVPGGAGSGGADRQRSGLRGGPRAQRRRAQALDARAGRGLRLDRRGAPVGRSRHPQPVLDRPALRAVLDPGAREAAQRARQRLRRA